MGGVGKSSVTLRFMQDAFLDCYDPTIEDSYRKMITVSGIPKYVPGSSTKTAGATTVLFTLFCTNGVHGFVLIFPNHFCRIFLYQCCPIVCDAGPTLNQHWFNGSCLPGKRHCWYLPGSHILNLNEFANLSEHETLAQRWYKIRSTFLLFLGMNVQWRSGR